MELMPRLEREMAAPVAAHYRALGHRVEEEVHFNGRIADVIAVSPEREVTSIELKLRDWETAHRQAIAYQVGCHRSYVALPLVVVQRLARRAAFRDAFHASGCGLLAVNHPFGDVREIVPARASARRLDFLGEWLARER